MPPRRAINDYPADWPEISRRTKEEAGWKCIRCGHPDDVARGYGLTVHHLDLDKANCRWWNLAALCQRCHLQIQHKVVMQRPWIFDHAEWFKIYAAGYYAFHYLGQDLTRAEVTARLPELLALEIGRPPVQDVVQKIEKENLDDNSRKDAVHSKEDQPLERR